MRGTEERADDWLELTEKAFDFATYARVRFKEGDLMTKREILMTLGENLVLLDNKLTLQQSEWLVELGKSYPSIEAKYLSKVGTKNKANSKKKEEALKSIYESWRATRDSNYSFIIVAERNIFIFYRIWLRD